MYQPGYAGNFLKFLFSLDPSTAPYLKHYTTQQLDPQQRLTHYSFENAKKFDHWQKFHHSQDDSLIDQYHGQYPTIVKAVHPVEFQPPEVYDLYQAELDYDEFSSFWLTKTKELWCGFPMLRTGEKQIEDQIKRQYSPEIININNFLNPMTWQHEYEKICDSMCLPTQIDTATQLYQSWYNLRVHPLKQLFDQLTSEQKQNSIRIRKLHETQGQPSPWQYVYDRIRDSSWPDCNSEKDFYKLPDSIQSELINSLGGDFIFEKLDRKF